MAVSWKPEYNPQIIAKRLEDSKTVNSSGVQFRGFEYAELVVLLYSMLKFPDLIPEVEGRGIVSKAIFAVGKKTTITPQSLLTEISKLEAEYSKRPAQSYVLVTSLSLNRAVSLPKLKLGNATIQFEPQLPRRYEKESAKVLTQAQHSLFADVPDNYLFARVRVSAKSIFEAADTSLNALDLVRSIWNWFYNRPRFIRMSSGKRQPVNKIVSGPLHTLHKPSGVLADETWWYDPNYHGAVQVHNLNQELGNLNKFYRSVRARLARSKYRQSLEEALIRYGRALDDHDWNNAYLKLWSVLEFLTHSARESHQVAIRRTAFILEDREYHLQVLNHLRDYRNRSVHAGADNSEIETYMFQLKNYVESLLVFHLASKYGFSSLGESATFLDLPTDQDTLQTRVRMMQYARRFLGHTKSQGRKSRKKAA